MKPRSLRFALSPLLLALASCGVSPVGESSAKSTSAATPFAVSEVATFKEPWAMAFVPGTTVLFVTEQGGAIKGYDTANNRAIFVTGVPKVDYGGQGGLGDIAFLPGEAAATLTPRTIYLTWAEAGEGDTRGAVLARGKMVCEDHQTCDIRDLGVIWRQSPKTTGRGHYSHRIAFSPDGAYLFLASGDRQKMAPAQDLTGNLGKILRLNLDGTPAPGNPWSARGGIAEQVWTMGNRNVLGMKFDAQGRLWEVEHGPRGGDELNLVGSARNFGWPLVSEGDHYGGGDIPPHSSRRDVVAPALSWNPVIGPGDFIFYRGDKFPAWRGQAIIAGLVSQGLVRVAIDGTTAREVARHPLGQRIRGIAEGPDGTIWVIEDDPGGRLLKVTPK